MKCPNDQSTLLISERSGIEIDYCPECRGVWLDRGELDKLIDHTSSDGRIITDSNRQTDDYRHKTYDTRDEQTYKKKKKESFFADLFEF